MAVHHVKSWTHLFQAIKSGAKTHDIRDMSERPYAIGDTMILEEWDFVKGGYTGDSLAVEITYVTDNKTPCAFSSAVLDKRFGVLSVRKLNDGKIHAGSIRAN